MAYTDGEIDQKFNEALATARAADEALAARLADEVAHLGGTLGSRLGDVEARVTTAARVADQEAEHRLLGVMRAEDQLLGRTLGEQIGAGDRALEQRLSEAQRDAAAAVATQLTAAFQSAQAALERRVTLPRGMVLMWSGPATAVPAGWTLCNGQNGSPDLQDRFILGAGREPAGSAGPGDTHSHELPALSVQGRTSAAGEHQHKLPSRWYGRSFDDGGYRGIDTGSGNFDENNPEHFIQPGGEHEHSLSAATGATRTAAASALRPKWYALCFIMKL
jgi:hypothetical protein